MPTDDQQGTAVLVTQRGDRDVKLIRTTLRRVGFAVVNAVEGAEAKNLLTAGGPSPRLAVIDPATPGLDFPQLLRQLHETGSDVRVLCLCEEGMEEALHLEPYADRIGGHLRRPFRRAHLLASILEVTEKPLMRTA